MIKNIIKAFSEYGLYSFYAKLEENLDALKRKNGGKLPVKELNEVLKGNQIELPEGFRVYVAHKNNPKKVKAHELKKWNEFTISRIGLSNSIICRQGDYVVYIPVTEYRVICEEWLYQKALLEEEIAQEQAFLLRYEEKYEVAHSHEIQSMGADRFFAYFD